MSLRGEDSRASSYPIACSTLDPGASGEPTEQLVPASEDAAAAAGPNTAGTQDSASMEPAAAPVHQFWHTAFDYNSRRWYFYNTATGERQWHPPPGWLPPPALPPQLLHPAHAAAMAVAAQAAAMHRLNLAKQQTAVRSDGTGQAHLSAVGAAEAAGAPAATLAQCAPAAAPAPAAAAAAGYYYRDAYGIMQGPFTKEQLQGWRDVLPMDLMITYRGPDSSKQQQQEENEQLLSYVAPPVAVHSLELAKVLGDGELLARWQGDNPEKAAVPGSAPPAGSFERELASGGGYSAYAAAALAGLPASDDAVQVARIAAHSGKSLEEILDFNYGSGGVGDYTATALHSRGRGRVQAADAKSEGLYDEMGRWVDSTTIEAQLARAAESRKRGLSGKELATLKARKQEMKRKKTMDWLMR